MHKSSDARPLDSCTTGPLTVGAGYPKRPRHAIVVELPYIRHLFFTLTVTLASARSDTTSRHKIIIIGRVVPLRLALQSRCHLTRKSRRRPGTLSRCLPVLHWQVLVVLVVLLLTCVRVCVFVCVSHAKSSIVPTGTRIVPAAP